MWHPAIEAVRAVSIHASREGRDQRVRATGAMRKVSIHASREGLDITTNQDVGSLYLFQSTRPVKDATPTKNLRGYIPMFQSTRPVKDATWPERLGFTCRTVSIHASREGRDDVGDGYTLANFRFQSTRPVKDATKGKDSFLALLNVSIHASREGRDP